MRHYFEVRLMNKQDGSAATPCEGFDDLKSAQKRFYQICGDACDKGNISDAVMLTDLNGDVRQKVVFRNDPEKTEE